MNTRIIETIYQKLLADENRDTQLNRRSKKPLDYYRMSIFDDEYILIPLGTDKRSVFCRCLKPAVGFRYGNLFS